MPDRTWNFQDPASKDRVLGVLQHEIDEFVALTSDPARWHAPTACAGWEVRDMVGHLIDATESYLSGFELARGDPAAAPTPIGLAGMAEAYDEAARSFRGVRQDELIDRHRNATERLMQEFRSLTDEEWSKLIVRDRYLPLPAAFVAIAMLDGYAVHAWDVRQEMGIPHTITGDAADLLVPYIFILWSATADTTSVEHPYTVGVRTTGHNGGDVRAEVATEGVRFVPGDIEDCGATLECDPATLVLVAYERINAGTVRGDRELVAKFRSLFVSI